MIKGITKDSFKISLESFRSVRGSLLHKSVTGQELFFALSYSKPALETYKAVELNLHQFQHFRSLGR